MNDRFGNQVLAKQVELIFHLLPIGIIATVINSAIISILLWDIVPRILLYIWLMAHLTFAVLRIFLYTFFKREKLKVEHSKIWERAFTAFLIVSGVVWGCASFFGIFHDSIAHQTVVAIVLGGMCSGAAATYSALRGAYYGFLIPALLPQIIIFFVMASSIHLALAIMLLLFGILISFSAETNHSIISSNFMLLLKNEDLISYLRDLNKKAQSEIIRRKQIEVELLKSRTDLEKKVKERTVELSEANKGLKIQIKKRVKVEQALRDSEIYYRSIVETAQEGIWVIDEKHRISYANGRMAQMLGYSTEELHGKDICEFLDAPQRAYHGFDRRVRGVRQKNLRKNDGTFMSVIEAESTMFDQTNLHNLRLGMVTDITERQIWEKKIVDLNNRLHESNSELSEFSYSVSHDLRAPLHTIDAFSSLIEEEYGEELDENKKKYLSTIRKSAARMNDLISDLLTLSKVSRSELNKENVDLSAMVEDIVNGMRNREPERVVEVQISKAIFANCDPGLIRIVLENLLNNSWKFTSKIKAAKISFGTDIRDSKQIIYLYDNGAGFNMKYKEKLFQPFQRLHAASEFQGTGIGLATVHRIIQKHGGEVWAESEQGKGATFYFTL